MGIFVAITSPTMVSKELETVIELINLGWCIHVRRPDWSTQQIEQWLTAFDDQERSAMRIHGHEHLVATYGLAGRHLRGEEALPQGVKNRKYTKSFHEINTIRDCAEGQLTYGFLSPIFPSITKRGYEKKWDQESLRSFLCNKRRVPTVALGGIDLDRIEEVRRLNFDGLAVMGAFWQLPKTNKRIALAQRIMKTWENHA